MSVAILALLVVVVVVSSQVTTVQDRVDAGMAIWGATMAHCRENSGKGDWEVDKEKFKACKKCFSGVGDWLTPEGLERGMACLEEFEPQTIESCGEMMNKLPESNFDQEAAHKIQLCWEDVHLRSIGEKCMKSPAGKDMVLASLCVMNHLRQDHHYAEQVILGESPEEQGDPTKPSRLQRVLESLFVEGRCIHANEGNDNRIAECVTCFNKAMPMLQGEEMMEKDDEKHTDKEMEHHLKKIWSRYAACANVYLAPAYSDCMDQMDEILEKTIEEWRSPGGKAEIDQLQACLVVKQSKYWWKDCISAAGEGVEGLMTFRSCARNKTMSWVASRRPQALDMLDLFWKGHGNTVEDGGLITELV